MYKISNQNCQVSLQIKYFIKVINKNSCYIYLPYIRRNKQKPKLDFVNYFCNLDPFSDQFHSKQVSVHCPENGSEPPKFFFYPFLRQVVFHNFSKNIYYLQANLKNIRLISCIAAFHITRRRQPQQRSHNRKIEQW